MLLINNNMVDVSLLISSKDKPRTNYAETPGSLKLAIGCTFPVPDKQASITVSSTKDSMNLYKLVLANIFLLGPAVF
jgi:hypothetical protein